MSHELRTPLNAILGFSEVMKNELLGTHAVPVYGEYCGDIHDSGQHLLNLINEILDLSRIEAGRYELNEEAVSARRASPKNAIICSRCARATAASPSTISYEPDLPKLWADERAVRQICLNLLSNAIKFTPQGGEIWIKVGLDRVGRAISFAFATPAPAFPEDEISDRAVLVRPGIERA